MKPITHRIGLAIGVLGLVTTTAPPASAGPVTYTETVTASGRLGATGFTDALMTLTATADTADVTNPFSGLFVLIHPRVTVDVAGVGSAVITEDLYMFVNQPFRIAGIADQIGGYEVLNVTNSVFATYDLKTSVGPVSGPTSFNESSIGFATTAGYLYLFSTSGTGTFQASVPEPSTMTLAAIGILGLQCFRWRRHARAVA
jgi:hypothetical protein